MHWVTINPLGSMKLPQHIRGAITDKNYDYKAISRLKFCVLPEHVQKAIGPILV